MFTEDKNMKICEAREIHGGLSKPFKMKGATSWSLPPKRTCKNICPFCYARKGRYCFKNVETAQENRFNLLMEAMQTDKGMEQWVKAMVSCINKERHRWHDAGDTFHLRYAYMIIWVARCTPGVKHYCPTKRIDIWREAKRLWGIPSNLVVRKSAMPHKKPDKKVWSHHGCIDSNEGISCPVRKGDQTCEDYGCFACWDPSVLVVDYHLH